MGISFLRSRGHVALEWAAFSKVANITKNMKAGRKIKSKVHDKHVLSVMVYGSEI